MRLTLLIGTLVFLNGCNDKIYLDNKSEMVTQNVYGKLDVLFVMDNSRSMAPMNQELRAKFGQFLKVFQDEAAVGWFVDLHIGVINTDFGAGATGAAGGCAPFGGGGGGKLIALGNDAAADCQAPTNNNFIEFKFDANVGQGNLPVGQDLLKTFTCMASLDATLIPGCGVESPLEAAYAALKNDIPDNAGFVRDDAALVVVFLTNEDDCSAPGTTDLFSSGSQPYGALNSYRCSNYGVMCNGQLMPYGDSGGPLSNCVPAPNPGSDATHNGSGPGKLMDISRYIDLFTKSASEGGLKNNPQDVILVGINAADTPVQSILALTNDNPILTECSPLNEFAASPCVPTLQHSCINPNNPIFYGDPAVRLNTVIKSTRIHSLMSICNDDYSNYLSVLGTLANAQTGGGCLAGELPDPSQPDCTVNAIDNEGVQQPLYQCREGSAYPCWVIAQDDSCTATASHLGMHMRTSSSTETRLAPSSQFTCRLLR